MSLIPKPTEIAAELSGINRELISYLRAQARRSYDLANTAGQQQAILDVMGDTAVTAIQTYGAIYQLLTSLGASDGLDAPDTNIFQPQSDGTVVYVAPPPPPEPEIIVEEPSPESP